MAQKKFVNCFNCSKQVDVQETGFDSEEEALAAEFECKVCVLTERLEKIVIDGCKEFAKGRTCSQLVALEETALGSVEVVAAEIRCRISFVTERLDKVEKRVPELLRELSRARVERQALEGKLVKGKAS